MHYRVSVYNYFYDNFRKNGYEFIVRADMLQKENTHPIKFDFAEIPFKFHLYRKEINRIKPDFVIFFLHLRDLIIFPLIYWLKSRHITVIFWTKGKNLDNPDSFIVNTLYYHTHNQVDGIILYSKKELDFIKPKNHHKVTFANNTINFADFPDITESKETIKKELHIPFKKVALFVGRMEINKGRKRADHAIRIFNTLTNPDYGLVLVGSGFNDEMKSMINKKNTMYLGEIHDPGHYKISKIFKMSDVFIIPGHVGLGLNQAFYWGLPVITEEGKQPPEIHYLVDGRNGFMVKENDIAALKEKLLYLLENDHIRAEFGKKARADIIKNASIENMFNGFLENIKLKR